VSAFQEFAEDVENGDFPAAAEEVAINDVNFADIVDALKQ